MEGNVTSEKNIKAEISGKKLSFKTEANSSLRIEGFKDCHIRHMVIEDEEHLVINIIFWRQDENGHISDRMYTIKKDEKGKISVFEGSKKLVKQTEGKKEKIKAH